MHAKCLLSYNTMPESAGRIKGLNSTEMLLSCQTLDMFFLMLLVDTNSASVES